MKKAIIVLFITTCSCVSAQTLIDSLLTVLSKQRNIDSLRLSAWINLSNAFDGETALHYSDSAITLAQKINDPERLALAFSSSGNAYNYLGDDSAAIVYYRKALNIFESIKNKEGIAKISHRLGISYYNHSDYTSALVQQQKALSIYRELKYLKQEAGTLNSIGIIYMDLGNYPYALENYFNAVKIFSRVNDKESIARTYMNIGILYKNLKNGSKALTYQQKALEVYITLDNKRNIAMSYNNIGNVYSVLKYPDTAITYYREALALNETTGYKFGTASNLSNLGIAYYDLKKYDSAFVYLNKSILLYKELHDHDNLALCYEYLGDIYFNAPVSFFNKLNVSVTQRWNKAGQFYNESLSIFQEADDISGQSDVYESLSKLYEVRKDFANALYAHKHFITLRDSIVNDEKKTEIARKEIQFDFDKKEALSNAEHSKAQALANAEIKRQTVVRNSVISGAGILLMSAAFSFVFYKRRRDAEKKKMESDLKAEISEVEMKALRSQMNPHFIFNSLNSISEFILKNDTTTADNYLSKFAKVMRMILENSEQKEVPLAADLKALELYMQLEALRMNNKFVYEIAVDNAIDSENTLIPPLILQPFVENSIRHGMSKKQGNGKIKISIAKENEMIRCTVEDDGVGRSNSKSKQNGKSLGMKITGERIQLINKLKKSKAAINLTDLAEGFKVEVMLPLQLSF